MVRRIEFLKVSGAGNDFVLVDNSELSYEADWSAFSRSVCSRPFGVGADGLLIVEPSKKADFEARYFNADGSTGAMCGNGGRCVARYAFAKGLSGQNVQFEMNNLLYQASVGEDAVSLRLPDTKDRGTHAELDVVGYGKIRAFLVDTGAPHAVIRTDDLRSVNILDLGRKIREHPSLSPSGANADFYQIGPGREIGMRTYERGVEGETYACGTGAVAVALCASVRNEARSPVHLRTRGGEVLSVMFDRGPGRFREITLTGSAHLLYSGTVLFDDLAGRIQPFLPSGIREAR